MIQQYCLLLTFGVAPPVRSIVSDIFLSSIGCEDEDADGTGVDVEAATGVAAAGVAEITVGDDMSGGSFFVLVSRILPVRMAGISIFCKGQRA